MRRDAKGAEALLPRMNAGAPTEERSARNAGFDRTLSGEKNDGRALAENSRDATRDGFVVATCYYLAVLPVGNENHSDNPKPQ
jgi:hypothetical protein